MKKFNFSLEKVLQLKNQILKSLKNDLGNLQLQLRLKEDDIQNLKNKFKATDEVYVKKSLVSIQPDEIRFYKDYMDSLVNQIKKHEDEKEIILKKIEKKKQEIINMNIEISSIEKLKEKKLEQYNKDLQKIEELFIEEFVSTSSVMKKQIV